MYFSRECFNSFSVKGIRDLLRTNGVVLFWADFIMLQEYLILLFGENQWGSDK